MNMIQKVGFAFFLLTILLCISAPILHYVVSPLAAQGAGAGIVVSFLILLILMVVDLGLPDGPATDLELRPADELVDELSSRFENVLIVLATTRRQVGDDDECFYLSRGMSDGSGLLECCVADALKRYALTNLETTNGPT